MADKKPGLAEVLAQIDKTHGKGTVRRMGDSPLEDIHVFSTGSIALDYALGVGGLPRGRIVEIYGQPSGGKTTLALQTVAAAQRTGGVAAYIDAEHALDPAYARALGVDLDNLVMCQPDSAEQALQVADALISSGEIAILVIDSVAALVPRAEINGEIGDAHMALTARLMGQALRKITGPTSLSQTLVIFINQLRERPGVMFGSPLVTTGGKALPFYASVRIDISRIETVKDGTVATGNRTRAKIVKNKCARPFTQAEFEIEFGKGVCKNAELVDLGVEHQFIKKSGSWYTTSVRTGETEQLGQGRVKVIESLDADPEFAEKLEVLVRGALGI